MIWLKRTVISVGGGGGVGGGAAHAFVGGSQNHPLRETRGARFPLLKKGVPGTGLYLQQRVAIGAW